MLRLYSTIRSSGIRIQSTLFEVETKQSPKRAKNVIIDSKYFEITKNKGILTSNADPM